MRNKIVYLEELSKEDKIKALITFDRSNELREELGWFEHTADWDPFLVIKTKTGDIETEAGYSNMEIIGYQKNKSIAQDSHKINAIRVFVEDLNNDEQVIEKDINIDEIISLTWAAH